MAFKIGDFKKTIRGAGEARIIYPHQIRDGRHTAAIGYAIGYYEQMLGRQRADFEAGALLEFFGDPRLARGFVACLAGSYRWRTPTIAEALGTTVAQVLGLAGIYSAADLRSQLYLYANKAPYAGFIAPSERRVALRGLAVQIEAAVAQHQQAVAKLRVEQLEQLLTLDGEDQQLLERHGARPEAEQLIERYNYHSLETALIHAESIRLQLHGQVWPLLTSSHNLAQSYRIGYLIGEHPTSLFDDRLDLTLCGQRDALGSWARSGRRMVLALLRLLAAHPGCQIEGEALVHIGGRRATLRLDQTTLRFLGATAKQFLDIEQEQIWEANWQADLRRAWNRWLVAGKSNGWQMRRDPEPLIIAKTVIAADFSIRRGRQSIGICVATGRAAAASLAQRLANGGAQLPLGILVQERAASALRGAKVTIVPYNERPADALPELLKLIEARFPEELRIVNKEPTAA